MIWLIVFLIVYLLSVLKMYTLVRTQHSEGGEFSSLDVWTSDFIFTFVPYINTIAALTSLTNSGKKYQTPNKGLNRLFGVKK